MTIEAELPDGTILEFPDGTQPEVIKRAAQRFMANAAQAQQAASAPLPTAAPEPERPLGVGRGSAYSRAALEQLRASSREATDRAIDVGIAAGQGALLNYGDEALAFARSLGGADYDQALQEARARYEAIPEGRRIVGEILGGLGTAALTGGASQAARAATLAGRLGRTAGLGALTGGVAAYGAGEGGTEARAENALSGAALGGGLGAAGGAISAGARGLRNALTRGSERFNAAAGEGVPLSLGQALDNKPLQLLERTLASTPGGAGRFTRLAQDQENAATAAIRRASGVEEPIDVALAGERLQGATRDVLENTRKAFNQQYEDLFNRVGADRPVQVSSVQALRDDLASQADANPDIASTLGPLVNRIDRILSGASEGIIPFGTLRQLRTNVGRDLDRVSDNLSGETKRLYGALTDDLKAGVAQDPELGILQTQLDSTFADFAQNRRPLFEKIVSQTPEDATRRLTNQARAGGTQFQRVLNEIPEEAASDFRGAVINQLGRATQTGKFSPARFAMQFRGLTERAQEALGGSNREALNRAVIASELARAGERFANPSGTAQQALSGLTFGTPGLQAVTGDLSGAATTLAALYGIPFVAARPLTSQRFIGSLLGSPGRERRALNRLERDALTAALVGANVAN